MESDIGPEKEGSLFSLPIAAAEDPFDLRDEAASMTTPPSLFLSCFTVHTSLDSFPRLRRDFAAGDYFQWASRGRGRVSRAGCQSCMANFCNQIQISAGFEHNLVKINSTNEMDIPVITCSK